MIIRKKLTLSKENQHGEQIYKILHINRPVVSVTMHRSSYQKQLTEPSVTVSLK